MSGSFCPACGEPIASVQINVEEGVALCKRCGQLSRLSDVADNSRPITEILRRPPRGCTIREWGEETLIRATLRSLAGFFGATFVALFWNGIVSVFVMVAAGGLYTNLVGPIPGWFPAPAMDDDMSLGIALFLCVFLTPFVLIGAGLAGAVLLCAGGKVDVRIFGNEGAVATGIGPFVWRQPFDPAHVRRVRTAMTPALEDTQRQSWIVIEADRNLRFGTMLSEERREWLRAALQVLLVNDSPKQRDELLSS